MKKTFQEVVDESTAQGQLFETKELLHSNGNTYKEFINTPKTLKKRLLPVWSLTSRGRLVSF